jgi:hypothetical protein
MILDVAPAEDVTLWLWCFPDLSTLLRVRPQLAAVAVSAYGRRERALRSKDARILEQSRRGEISTFQKLAGIATEPAPLGVETQRAAQSHRPTSRRERRAKALETHGRRLMRDYLFAVSDGVHQNFIEASFRAEHRAQANEILNTAHQVLTDVLFEPSPFSGVTGYTTARIVHAVERPLAVPQQPDSRSGFSSLCAVRVKPDTWTALKTDPAIEDKLADLLKGGGGEPGGTEIYFSGHISFDRPSTGDVRVEARRVDFRYESAVRRINANGTWCYVDRPPMFDTAVFTLKSIPRDPGQTPPGYLDVLRDELGALRNLTDTGDPSLGAGGVAKTAALELDLRIVGTSRFTDYFPAEDTRRPANKLSKFEVESRPVTPAGAYWSVGASSDSHSIRCVLPATSRPCRPVITRVEWITPERRARGLNGELRVDKWFIPRLYLDNTWRFSGLHELLAVALLPTDSVSDFPYRPERSIPPEVHPASPHTLDPVEAKRQGDLHRTRGDTKGDLTFYDPFPGDDKTNPLGCTPSPPDWFCELPHAQEVLPFVSRWGSDATTAPFGRLDDVIPPSQFSGYVASLSRLNMPKLGVKELMTTDSPSGQTVPVSVLLFKPMIDADTGEWFVDIPINPGLVHLPFVRLSLARYQPISMRGLELSEPMLLDAFRVPAKRSVEIYNRNNEALITHIYGVGNIRREPYGTSAETRSATDAPLQNIELVRLVSEQTDARIQTFDQRGDAIRRTRIQPTLGDGRLIWVCEIPLPDTWAKQRYGLRIDEINLHVPDSAIDRDAVATMNDLIEQPAYFSLSVDLASEGLVDGPTLG